MEKIPGYVWYIDERSSTAETKKTCLRLIDNPPAIYARLEEGEIRLVAAVSDLDNGPIRLCTLVGQLDQAPQYTALSYTWGESPEVENIYVNSIPHQISKNLAGAIRNCWKRPPFKANNKRGDTWNLCPIWADALCINQQDEDEKSKQVQRMAEIYDRAYQVMAWLGDDDGQQAKTTAIAFIHLIGTSFWSSTWGDFRWARDLAKHGVWTYRRKPGQPHEVGNLLWNKVYDFLTLPYWSRSWIVQEMVFARKLFFQAGQTQLESRSLLQFSIFVLCCRDHIITPTDLDCDTELWLEIGRLHLLQEAFGFTMEAVMKRQYAQYPQILEEIDRWAKEGETGIQDINSTSIPPNLRNAPQEEREAYRLRLLPFRERSNDLERSIDLLATDPRDKLFAFYAFNVCPIAPNYSLDTRTVYSRAADRWVRTGELASFLKFCGTGYGTKTEFDLPSWIPDWYFFGQARRKQPTLHFSGTARAPPECFSFIFSIQYQAAKGLEDIPMSVHHNYSELHTFGVRCSSAVALHSMDQLKTFSEILDLSKYTVEDEVYPVNPHGFPLAQYMIRTLMADTDPSPRSRLPKDGPKAEVLARGLVHCFQQIAATEYGGRKNYIQDTFPSYGWDATQESFADFFQQQFMPWMDLQPGTSGDTADFRVAITHTHPKDEHYLGKVKETLWRLIQRHVMGINMSSKIFILADGGIGLGPWYMMPGDLVVVLSSCSFPVLLRSHGEKFRLVGPCFVLHLMDGQAAEMVARGETDIERFMII